MKERFILAPGLNGTELTQSLALHGVNCIGLRICGAAELARLALMRSGIPIAEDFVSTKEEAALTAKALSGTSYFGRPSYSDIQEIAAAIKRMRSLVASGDERAELERVLAQGVFKEKNEALLHVYQNYMALLKDRNAVDAVSLIRRAVEEGGAIDAEFLMVKEFPLCPLEISLLHKVSGGNFTETDLCALYGVKEEIPYIDSIRNCYGTPNEVESILEDIYASKHLDRCTVAVTDTTTLSQLFFDYALLYDIPVTFGCGIPITNSNPARLTALYFNWITGGFFGAEALRELLSAQAFNKAILYEQFPEKQEGFRWNAFLDVLGSLRLTNDRETNEKRLSAFRKTVTEEATRIGKDAKEYRDIQRKLLCIPYLEIMAEELALPPEEFITKYSYIRKGTGSHGERLVMMLDLAASKTIYDELKVIRGSGVDQHPEDVIPNILRLHVCAQRSEAGKLHITGIDGALSAIRGNLYIAGLSASCFPGSRRENYLLLDTDLKLFGPGAHPFTADGRILRKRSQLLGLCRLASSLGTKVSVSYSGLNVSELKKDNPSSLVFELFREEHGFDSSSSDLEESIKKVGYFEPAISGSRQIGIAYTEGKMIRPGTSERVQVTPVPWNTETVWSPTALGTFFDCPRRFMLWYLLGVPEPEEYDPFEIISAMDMGTLAHSLMEALGGTSMSLDEFMTLSKEYFDRFLAEHPPLIAEKVPAVRDQFLEMMETAYETDPHREIALKEEDIFCTHESGVKLHGFPDRVEKLEDGTCLIVDFKSGRKITHVEDDIGTCMQVILYAYLMEQKGFQVSGGEYRYIRLGETVPCRYDPDMKQLLEERLTQFQDCMKNGVFPTAEVLEGEEGPCRYCKYTRFCEGPVKIQGKEGEPDGRL